MDSHVGAINEAKLPLGTFGRFQKESLEELLLAKAAEPSINRFPRPKVGWQVSPRIPAPQDVEDGLQYGAQIGRRTAYSKVRSRTRGGLVNLFSPFQVFPDMPLKNFSFIPKFSEAPKEYKS